MSVIDLATARLERSPHIAGPCVCLHCRHEWTDLSPKGQHVGIKCPSCELPKGVFKYLCGPSNGDLVLHCNCGCEALTCYIREGLKYITCMNCGTDLTERFFGD